MTKYLVFDITDHITDKYRNTTQVFVIAAHIAALYFVREKLLRLLYLTLPMTSQTNSAFCVCGV
jgi:hypothetical protein